MRYRPVELGVAGKPACPDEFNEASTLICPKCSKLVLQVSKQAVVVQFGLMLEGAGSGPGAVEWQSNEPYLPLIASLSRKFDAVRFRNYTPGEEAQVLATVT